MARVKQLQNCILKIQYRLRQKFNTLNETLRNCVQKHVVINETNIQINHDRNKRRYILYLILIYYFEVFT